MIALKKKPKSCTECGRKLKSKRERTGYDEQTGEPVYMEILECPSSAFLNTNHGRYKKRSTGWYHGYKQSIWLV